MEPGILKVFNNLGISVYSAAHNGKLSLDLSHLPKGIYHYQAEGITKSLKGKLVLK
ncbi:MAG: T9SS type A sorting domain-containing protein [Opitutaceae bacterium]|nr:T9SS type A sorting domain-containing protein [Cytophagales bacterium]